MFQIGEWRVLIADFADVIVERANRAGAVCVDTSPVSLRELFLETVKLGEMEDRGAC